MNQIHSSQLIRSLNRLRLYSEKESFKGWDPYDGLNSQIFQALPLKYSAISRLLFIQGFKRSPVNLRVLAKVPKEYNAKGIGLFLQGYCNLYKCIEKDNELINIFGTKETILTRVYELADILISLRSEGFNGTCWGYNFDWQARRLFLFPKNTPTVVATCFCASALIDAYKITENKEYLSIALKSADFIIKDLHRTHLKEGFLFSYSPLNGNDTVFNASLLGSKLLSLCYYYTKNPEYKELARQSVLACCNEQAEDGSWKYGMHPVQSWIDSFHTGYNLDALKTYEAMTDDTTFSKNIEKGLSYYINHFFDSEGIPHYYNNKKYPIDIHCPGQLFVTLYRLKKISEEKELADKVLYWTIRNMQAPDGFFYYQKKKIFSSHISYMRWSNAFMFNSLSFYLLGKQEYDVI